MRKAFSFVLLAIIAGSFTTGCIDPAWWETTFVQVAGVEGDQVWFAYQRFPDPASPQLLWRADLSTGQLQQVRSDLSWPARVDGDFLVMVEALPADEPLENAITGRVKAIRLSSGEETVVEEVADPFAPVCSVADGQVAVVTNQELVLYDLSGNEATETIELPAGTWWLMGFDEGKAMMWEQPVCDDSGMCDSENWQTSLLLVDTGTGEMTTIPDPSSADDDGFLLSGGRVAALMSTYLDSGELAFPDLQTLMVFDIATGQWRTVAEFQAFSPNGLTFDMLRLLVGFDGHHALLLKPQANLLRIETQIELVNTDTGETRTIGRHQGLSMVYPGETLLQNGRAIWIDPVRQLLFAYDVATGQTQTISLSAVTEP